MRDFKSIKITKREEGLEIHNPVNFPLVGMDSSSAVFKLPNEQCVKIYTDPEQLKNEADALKAGQHLSFIPEIYEMGPNFIVTEYVNGPPLKEYVRNCTYLPESLANKLLAVIKGMASANLAIGNAPLEHIFVLDHEELKCINPVISAHKTPPVPIPLLRDLKGILLQDSFLTHVKNSEPKIYKKWMKFFRKNRFDYKKITVVSGGSGHGVKTEDPRNLIGKGHQGAVYRVDDEKCVKIYAKLSQFTKEREVLLASQNLSFIPKVFETGPNFILMEYLQGPDLNTFLKTQSKLPEEVTTRLLKILKTMRKSGFKKIDAPLRHIIVTNQGFKLVDHVYSFSKRQDRPLELFRNLHERNFLDTFLDQVKALDPKIYVEWTSRPIPLTREEAVAEVDIKSTKKKRKKEKDKDKRK
ncbi:hypothetical protein [Mesobacillus subterraneus]|uniref:hypothetical protein n=1 Tax=Mesobacillus subterraneus TaxID=285983 RepID=UPI001B874297|nr:hypothetical protein [Mesobacillus subterraneus]